MDSFTVVQTPSTAPTQELKSLSNAAAVNVDLMQHHFSFSSAHSHSHPPTDTRTPSAGAPVSFSFSPAGEGTERPPLPKRASRRGTGSPRRRQREDVLPSGSTRQKRWKTPSPSAISHAKIQSEASNVPYSVLSLQEWSDGYITHLINVLESTCTHFIKSNLTTY